MNKWEKLSNEWKIKISENQNIEKWLSPIDVKCYFMSQNKFSIKSANKTLRNPKHEKMSNERKMNKWLKMSENVKS